METIRKKIKLYDKYYWLYNQGTLIEVETGKTVPTNINGKRGYVIYHFYVDGETKTRMVSRLVATHFVPNPDNLPIVNHDDGIKTNNYYKNLIWDSYSGNIKHAIRTGLITRKVLNHRGPIASKPVAKLSLEGVELEVYPSICSAAKLMGIDKNAISKVCLGKQKTAYGFKWGFKT